MLKSGRGNRTYRRGTSSTTRSTTSIDTNVLLERTGDDDLVLDTSRSVDTNVLLQRADDVTLDSARSAVSVDTDVLLGDLASTRDLEEPHQRGSATEVPLDSTYAKSTQFVSSGTQEPLISTNSTSAHWRSSASLDTEAPLNFASQSASLLTSSTSTKPMLNATFTQPTSLPYPPSSSSTGEHLSPGDKVSSKVISPFHADGLGRTRQLERSLVTARSVASADCAPVDYDDDVLRDNVEYLSSSGFEVSDLDKRHLPGSSRRINVHHNGSSDFEISALDKRHLPESSRPDNVHQNGSSGFEISALDKRPLPEGYRPTNVHQNGSSGFEASMLDQRRLSEENDDALCGVTGRSDSSLDAAMQLRDSTFSPAAVDRVLPDSGTTSRTTASVDTNVLLQTTEDVVMAMEAARTNHMTHIPPRDPSPPARNDPIFAYNDTDRNPYTREDVSHLDADYETETTDMGNTRVVPPESSILRKPPLAHGKSHLNSTANYAKHGTKEAWGNLSDYDIIPGDVGKSGQKTYGRKTVQLSQKRPTKVEFDGGSDFVGGSYFHSSEFDRRRYTEPLRTRSAGKTYPGQDSDRSLSSCASLGEKIVARSRQNQRPASSSSGRTQRTSGSAVQKNTQQHDRDLSPSGLVLEGCRVPLRPSSSASSHDRTDTRPSSAVNRRTVRGVYGTSESGGQSRMSQNGRSESRTSPASTKRTVTNARATSGSSVSGVQSQNGRSESRTSPAGVGQRTKRNGWTDDTSSYNYDSLYADGEPPSAGLNQQVPV